MKSGVLLIVEGLKDERQIRKALNGINEVNVLVTEGTKVNTEMIDEIYRYMDEGCTPYVLSDPDAGGLKLYEMVHSHFPDIKRIEVDINECGYCTGKKMKAGIEYSSYDYIKKIVFPLIGRKYRKKEYPICWD